MTAWWLVSGVPRRSSSSDRRKSMQPEAKRPWAARLTSVDSPVDDINEGGSFSTVRKVSDEPKLSPKPPRLSPRPSAEADGAGKADKARVSADAKQRHRPYLRTPCMLTQRGDNRWGTQAVTQLQGKQRAQRARKRRSRHGLPECVACDQASSLWRITCITSVAL